MKHISIQTKLGKNYYEDQAMKLSEILLSVLAVMFVNSCSSYYYVVTDVGKDLSVDRMVYAEASDSRSSSGFISPEIWAESSVDESFEVDFYDRICEMGMVYRTGAERISDLSFQPDKDNKGNPLFSPVETLDKRFRWFYTYYDYSARFKSLKDMLPLALDGYITPEQRTLFFKGQEPPQGWNGIEMYYLLDDVNSKFAEWYSDAVFLALQNMVRPYCSEDQTMILDECRDDFMKDMDKTVVFIMEPDDFVARLVEIYPDAGFDKVYDDNAGSLKSAYEKEAVLISYFGYSFIFTMDMPGKYYEGNAVDFIDGNPSWKVDAFRVIDEDLVLEAVSRKLNVWAFVLTFALIILLLQVFAKVFARR